MNDSYNLGLKTLRQLDDTQPIQIKTILAALSAFEIGLAEELGKKLIPILQHIKKIETLLISAEQSEELSLSELMRLYQVMNQSLSNSVNLIQNISKDINWAEIEFQLNQNFKIETTPIEFKPEIIEIISKMAAYLRDKKHQNGEEI